ncbi:MAG: tol-pal system protein YbgF [Gemmatimonadaceae bacterium]|nr:tol-pal system protein YbgF [Gemmatimonadaceae bacterium]
MMLATPGDRVVRFPHAFRRVWRLIPLVALVATGGCFATRGDVRIIQNDILSLRAELLRKQVEHQEALLQTQRILQVASDSLAKVSARTVGIQGDVKGEMRAVREQLLQVQTLLGQSQATISRLRSELEEQRAQAAAAVPPVSSPTTVPPSGTPSGGRNNPPPTPPASTRTDSAAGTAAGPASAAPGPNQLYVNGMDQLRRGSSSTARTLFQELLTRFPDSEYSAESQYWIGESLAKENNLPAADAAFAAVVSTYPNNAFAPKALYKRGLLLIKQGNNTQGKQLLEQVIARYPRSDEAELAADTLKTLR